MFLDGAETDEEGYLLRNGSRFCSGKRQRTMIGRESFNVTEREDYELVPHLNEESCDEEEEH